jgi:hypothetical protein
MISAESFCLPPAPRQLLKLLVLLLLVRVVNSQYH